MSNQTLALLLVTVVVGLICLTALALHGMIPGLIVAGAASSAMTGVFGFAQSSGSSKSVVTPTSATVTETTK